MTMKVITTPYNYQLEGSDFLFLRNYAVLGFGQGLGKTLTTLVLAEKAKSKTILILCPAFLKNNWENEFKVHTDERDILLCKTKADFSKIRNHNVVIMNYEQVKYLPLDYSFDLVAVDEVQYLKNLKAKRTVLFHAYVKNTLPKRLTLLSGTPITKGVSDWYSLLLLCSYNPAKSSGVDIRTKFKSEWAFSNHFCLKKTMNIKGRTITNFYGIRNKEHLRGLLKGKYIRRTSEQVLDLPEIVRKDVLISFSSDKVLEKAWEEFNSGSGGTHISTAKKESAIRKATFTSSYVTNLLENDSGPVVIFSEHPESARAIHCELSEKYRVGFIDGSIKAEDRDEIVSGLQRGQLDAISATIGAASVGFNITKSNNLVFNDKSWTVANNSQAEKRLHRIGQTKTTFIHSILGSAVDDRINKNLEEGQKIMEQAL